MNTSYHQKLLGTKRLLVLMGVVLSSILLALFVCELAMRVFLWKEQRDLSATSVSSSTSAGSSQFSIFSVGESSMVGEPYAPTMSIPLIIREYLQRSFPSKKFPIVSQAQGGADLHRLLPLIMNDLRRSPPDILVLMFGHNDFLANFGPNLECSDTESALLSFANTSTLFSFLYERYQRARIMDNPQTGPRSLLDKPIVCKWMFDRTIERFRSELEIVGRFVEQARIPTVFVFPASNEASFDPNRSVYKGPIQQRDLFESHMRCIQLYDKREMPHALLSCAQQASHIDSTFALLDYYRGKALRALNRTDEARDAFRAAKEHDGYPWRALDRQRDAMQEVAARHGIVFIDAAALLMKESESGLLDESLFHDMHHPSLLGYNAIAREVARRLVESGVLGKPEVPLQSIGLRDLVSTFRFTKTELLELFVSRIEWLYRISDVTFDPSERMRLLERNLAAASALDRLRTERILRSGLVSSISSRLAGIASEVPSASLEQCRSLCGITQSDEPGATTRAYSNEPALLDLYSYLRTDDTPPVHIGGVPSVSQYGAMRSVDGEGVGHLPLQIQGVRYHDGFVTHPGQKPAEVVFNFRGTYSRLSGKVAIADSASERASSRCQVTADGKVVFQSGVLRWREPVEVFSVDIAGANDVRLICDNADDSPDFDHAAWFDLKLDT